MKRTAPTLCSVLVAAAFAAPALAAEIPERGPIPFEAYDADGSGSISEQEFTETRNRRVEAAASAGRPMRGLANMPAFADFDTNGDSQLSREELQQGQMSHQQNRSGTGRGPGAGMGPGAGRGAGGGMGPGTGRGTAGNMPSFADFDLDGDGKLSQEEFIEARNRRIGSRAQEGRPMRGLSQAEPFEAIDADGDGSISPEEFSSHQQSHRQQR